MDSSRLTAYPITSLPTYKDTSYNIESDPRTNPTSQGTTICFVIQSLLLLTMDSTVQLPTEIPKACGANANIPVAAKKREWEWGKERESMSPGAGTSAR
jgi:hypothetical protein